MLGNRQSKATWVCILRDSFLLLLIATVLSVFTFWLHPKAPTWAWNRPNGPKQIELSEIAHWNSSVLWVDARDEDSYRRQHIPNAVLLNEGAWEELLPGFVEIWRPGARVIVYCDSQKCNASKEVAARLERELNLLNVYILKGGWIAWRQSKQ